MYPSHSLNISVQQGNMAAKYEYFRVKSSSLLRTLEPLFSKETLLLKENTSKLYDRSRLFYLNLQNRSISVISKLLIHISFAYVLKTEV